MELVKKHLDQIDERRESHKCRIEIDGNEYLFDRPTARAVDSAAVAALRYANQLRAEARGKTVKDKAYKPLRYNNARSAADQRYIAIASQLADVFVCLSSLARAIGDAPPTMEDVYRLRDGEYDPSQDNGYPPDSIFGQCLKIMNWGRVAQDDDEDDEEKKD